MAPIAIATMMEHIGDISAISATVGQNFIEDPGLHRTLIGDGIATSISAMIGGPANTTYGENTGVLELSRVHDPKVVRLAACYAIVLSFIPKVAEIIASMPASIIGGVSFILYGMISAIGVRNVVENHVDFTKSRNLIIAGVILVSGLGFSDGLTFTIGSTSITLTSLAIAAIAGIVLNAILPGNDYAFGKDPEGDASRGVDLRPHELEQELKIRNRMFIQEVQCQRRPGRDFDQPVEQYNGKRDPQINITIMHPDGKTTAGCFSMVWDSINQPKKTAVYTTIGW